VYLKKIDTTSSNIKLYYTHTMSERSATPPPSEAVLLARQELWAILQKGYAPTRKSNRKNVTTTSTVPSFLSGMHRPPPGGRAFTLAASPEARMQTLFILNMIDAEEEVVEEPAAKRLKKEGHQ
jgi:hypothetical protein